jgi:hypothetical protein
VVSAVILSLLLGAAPTPDLERAWSEGTRPRVEIGGNGALAWGFTARAEAQVARWSHGELGVGGLFATHFWFLFDPRREVPGVELRGTDKTFRLAPTVGHTFRFARHRVGISTWIWTGLNLRSQHSSLADPQHGLDERVATAAPFFELGAAMSVSVRLGRHLGLGLDVATPLWMSGTLDFGAMQLTTPAFAGLSVPWWF